MIAKYLQVAAQVARLMYDMGRDGRSKSEALAEAVNLLPASPFSSHLRAELRKSFDAE